MTPTHETGVTEPRLTGCSLDAMVHHPVSRNVLAFCLFETAFYFAYRYAMSFSHATASPFWFPDSVLLCALLLTRSRWWWVFLVAPLPIRLLVAVPPDAHLWFLLTTYAIDSAKGVLVAAALRRYVGNPVRFETVTDFALFSLFAVLLVPAGAAFFGAAARHALGFAYWPAWEQWFLGNALTHLIVTPAIFYWVLGAPWKEPVRPVKWVEAAFLTAGLALTGYVAFEVAPGATVFAETRFYAPMPFLFWAVLRFGMLGASGAIAVLAFFAISAAVDSHGPLSGLLPREAGVALQYFLLLRAAPFYLVAVLIEQKQGVEDTLRESESRFRNMADTAPVLIWVSRPDRFREFFSKGWLDFTGRTMEQERGNGWADGVHPEDLQRYLDVRQASFEARRPFEMEYRLRRYDGEYRWILDNGVPRFSPHGDFAGYIGSAIDITDRKGAEEANRALAHVSRLAVVGELTAMIAHEVNQPLGAILSNAEAAEMLLESDDPPLEEIRDILASIRRNDLRADEAIRRIRALLRRQEIQMQPLDLNETVADVIRLAAGDALQRQIEVHSELAEVLSLVSGDRVHLQQVLLNLIVNAMDAMGDTPVSARRLTVRTMLSGADSVEVAVADCGHGIPEDRMRTIFDSFVTTKPDGMGLGLSIARSIVEGHQGRIWAENNSTGGATFHFTVRVAEGGSAAGQASGNSG